MHVCKLHRRPLTDKSRTKIFVKQVYYSCLSEVASSYFRHAYATNSYCLHSWDWPVKTLHHNYSAIFIWYSNQLHGSVGSASACCSLGLRFDSRPGQTRDLKLVAMATVVYSECLKFIDVALMWPAGCTSQSAWRAEVMMFIFKYDALLTTSTPTFKINKWSSQKLYVYVQLSVFCLTVQ